MGKRAVAEDTYRLGDYAEAPGIAPIVLAYGLVALGGALVGLLLGWSLWA